LVSPPITCLILFKKIYIINRVEKHLKNLKSNIYYKLKIYQFKYNSSRIEGLKKEEEEVNHHWDHGANKKEHMYHLFVILAPCTIIGVQPSQHTVVLSQ
jgi:hypothetical protein